MNRNPRTFAISLAAAAWLFASGCGDDQKPLTTVTPEQPAAPQKVTMGEPTPTTLTNTQNTPASDSAMIAAPATQPAPRSTDVRRTTTQPQAPLGEPTIPAAPTESKIATFPGFKAPKPVTWLWQPTHGRQFVLAEYVVPGRDGADQARITISQAGGTLDSNIARWKTQFRPQDGEPVEPTLDTIQASGMTITLVEMAGEYAGMSGSYTPDTLFITAVIPTDPQQTFVKFVGPSKTVEANRQQFRAMIEGLERVEPEK